MCLKRVCFQKPGGKINHRQSKKTYKIKYHSIIHISIELHFISIYELVITSFLIIVFNKKSALKQNIIFF